LHKADEFNPNETNYCGNMTSYRFFKKADGAAQYYFPFYLSMSLPSEGASLSPYQIFPTYLDSQL